MFLFGLDSVHFSKSALSLKEKEEEGIRIRIRPKLRPIIHHACFKARRVNGWIIVIAMISCVILLITALVVLIEWIFAKRRHVSVSLELGLKFRKTGCREHVTVQAE